jgi:hypothetical protein
VWSWGAGTHGQLASGSDCDVFTPHLVCALSGKDVLQIACGGAHAVAVLGEWVVPRSCFSCCALSLSLSLSVEGFPSSGGCRFWWIVCSLVSGELDGAYFPCLNSLCMAS